MNFDGLIIGLATLAIIGIFHPIVIWAEYHFSEKIWPLFLCAALICAVASLYTHGVFSAILAVLGITCLWSIRELKEQTKRVQKGLFPKKPRK